MFFPKKSEFVRLAKKGNLIPVYTEVLADTETPVSAFSKIAKDNSFLLESVEKGENIGRYSFIGVNPYEIVYSIDDKVFLSDKIVGNNPLKVLKKILSEYKPVKVEGLPIFHGGAVGYLGYDFVRHIENLPKVNPDDISIPDSKFLLTDTFLVFDHVKHKILIVSNAKINENPTASYDKAVKKIELIIEKLKRKSSLRPLELNRENSQNIVVYSNVEKSEFLQYVKKAKQYIKNGDIIQVVLSQRFKVKSSSNPFDVYRVLRAINPSPYMYYFSFKGFKIIGTSPETLVRLEGKNAIIRPIAGTRPRGRDAQEDKKNEEELLKNEKEKAEHIMLVDLARNDLGRVCEVGTVKVDEFMKIEKYSHVMHIVSNVSGRLKKDKDAFDLLEASFPAGTVSGAPKVRAMEIIDELEKTKRGLYAGAVGYFDFAGNMDTCIAIRTILMKDGYAYVQSGAGIVADSIPEKEYLESVNKAKAMIKALEIVQK